MFEPSLNDICSKKVKPHANALVVNDLDRELSDDVLNQLAIKDALPEEFYQLSLNAISNTKHINCIKLKTRFKDKVMLILLDSGSSHSFVSSQFVQLTNLPTVPMSPWRVKLANGKWIVTNRKVLHLQCCCQGHTLSFDMNVLDIDPYDAMLWYDWLQQHSPMQCDWKQKTMEF